MNTMKLETFTLGGKQCKTIEAPIVGYDPKFNIPMMSDERWNEMANKKCPL